MLCDKSFISRDNLYKHLTRLGKNIFYLMCPVCNMISCTNRDFDIHIQKDHIKRYFECDICKHTLLTKYALSQHIQKIHNCN